MLVNLSPEPDDSFPLSPPNPCFWLMSREMTLIQRGEGVDKKGYTLMNPGEFTVCTYQPSPIQVLRDFPLRNKNH